MFGNFLMKQLLSRQLANVPEAEKQKILSAFEKNPALFEKIAEAIRKRTVNGESQMAAAMAVMGEHKTELEALLKD
jgi:hypothetical protein